MQKLTIQLPWGAKAELTLRVEDEPLFPTPNERGVMRDATVCEFRQILISLSKLQFECEQVNDSYYHNRN